jgi:hypothetical protein
VTSGLFTFLYILRFGLEDKKVELIRNFALVVIVLATFVRMSHWHIFFWAVPFTLVFAFYRNRMKDFRMSKVEIFGVLSLIASSIIYVVLYRWTKIPEYTLMEQSLLFFSIALSTLGTFLMMKISEFKKLWSFSTFAWNLWLTDHAKLFMVAGAIIPLFKSPIIAFGTQHFLSITLVVISNLLLILFLHRASKG